MVKETKTGVQAPTVAPGPVLLQAEPEPLQIDRQRTAVIVIDMQNAFVSKGGFFDLVGYDIAPGQRTIEPIKKITAAVRSKGGKVLYTIAAFDSDFHESGGPDSPWSRKLTAKTYLEHPEWRDKFPVRGTWGVDIIEELQPLEGDIKLKKPRYSAFFGTNLDTILKTYSVKYLVFVGVATNICVEATLRDAFYLGYHCILVSDATASSGPSFTQQATIFNVRSCYGWVTTTENIINAIH